MRPLGLLALVLLAACSEPPVIRDAGHDTRPEVAVDAGRDAVEWPDVEDLDAVEDVRDASADDAGMDAGLDAAEDAVLIDGGTDGLADGGRFVRDLTAPLPEESADVRYRKQCTGNACEPILRNRVASLSCFIRNEELSVSVTACGPAASDCEQVLFLVQLSADARVRSVVDYGGRLTVDGVDATIRAQLGPAYVANSASRQNVHLQFSVPPTASTIGATGVPGVSVADELGDVWAMGCQQR